MLLLYEESSMVMNLVAIVLEVYTRFAIIYRQFLNNAKAMTLNVWRHLSKGC